MLGLINNLVEHNECWVIILANQKEIGKIELNNDLVEKYMLVLNGDKLDFTHTEDEKIISIDTLQDRVEKIFSEDILYNSIKEKVIGQIIDFEPDIEEIYDSVIGKFSRANHFIEYMEIRKNTVLEIFSQMACKNIRTMIFCIRKYERIYREVYHIYNAKEDCQKYMDYFLVYLFRIAIYYRNGEKISALQLKDEIGYVSFPDQLIGSVLAFKYIDMYCINGNINIEKLREAVRFIDKIIKEEEKQKKKFGKNVGIAYNKLYNWIYLEDKEVEENIKLLIKELEDDKYSYINYQGIIAHLIVLKKNGLFNGDISKIVDIMIGKIENELDDIGSDLVYSKYSFEDDDLCQEYEKYVDKLLDSCKSYRKKIQSSDIIAILENVDWSVRFKDFCKEKRQEIIERGGFIDLVNIDKLAENLEICKTKEMYDVLEAFDKIYSSSNIGDFLSMDKEKIKRLYEKVNNMTFNGKTKQIIHKRLTIYLNEVIKKL